MVNGDRPLMRDDLREETLRIELSECFSVALDILPQPHGQMLTSPMRGNSSNSYTLEYKQGEIIFGDDNTDKLRVSKLGAVELIEE